MKCHCGKPLHYTDLKAKAMVDGIIGRLGRYMEVQTPEGTWLVDRHYIALHGIKSKDLPQLGFKEVVK